MGLFDFGKKKEEQSSCCSESCNLESLENGTSTKENGEGIKVLGSGCAKCNELEANVKKALEQLSMDTTIDHVMDFGVIAAYGVMSTPALVIDGKVVSYGKVLKVDEAVKIIEKARD